VLYADKQFGDVHCSALSIMNSVHTGTHTHTYMLKARFVLLNYKTLTMQKMLLVRIASVM